MLQSNVALPLCRITEFLKKISILTEKPAMTGRIVNKQAKIKQELTKLAKEKKAAL